MLWWTPFAGLLTAIIHWSSAGEDWVIATLEGWRRVNPGDWIVTDDSRNTWPMADEMFRLLYEQECVYPTDVS